MLLNRFNKALKYIGLKQDEIANKLDMSIYDLRNILTKKKKITPEIALKIEKEFKINPCWLIFGRGEMTTDIGFDLDGSFKSPKSEEERNYAIEQLALQMKDIQKKVNEIQSKYDTK